MKRLFSVVNKDGKVLMMKDDNGATIAAHFQNKMVAKAFRDEMNLGEIQPYCHVTKGPDHD